MDDEDDEDEEDCEPGESLKTNKVLIAMSERRLPDLVPNYDYFDEIMMSDQLVQLQPKTCWIYVASRDIQLNEDGSGHHGVSGTILSPDMFPHLAKNLQPSADGNKRYGLLGGAASRTGRAKAVDGLYSEDVLLHEYTRSVAQVWSRSAKRILPDWDRRFPALAAPLTEALRENPINVNPNSSFDDSGRGGSGGSGGMFADHGLSGANPGNYLRIGEQLNGGAAMLGSSTTATACADAFHLEVTLDFPSPAARFPPGAELHGFVQFTIAHPPLQQHRWRCVTRVVRPVELCAPHEQEAHAARGQDLQRQRERQRRANGATAVSDRKRRHGRRRPTDDNDEEFSINDDDRLEDEDDNDEEDPAAAAVRNGSVVTEHQSEVGIQFMHKHDCARMLARQQQQQQQAGSSGLTAPVFGSCDCVATPRPEIRVPFPATDWATVLKVVGFRI